MFYEGSSRKRARLGKHETDIVVVGDETTAAPGPAQPLHAVDITDAKDQEDTTATPEPAQPLFPEREEEEDEDDHEEDERVISDYDESAAEMTEEMVLKKLEKNCCQTKTISSLPIYLCSLSVLK